MSEISDTKDLRPIPLEIKRLKTLAKWMDSKFTIPGTTSTFGLDPLLNLVPGLGQAVDVFISLYIVFALYKNGTSGALVGKMLWNALIDSIVGAIPIVGYVFDFAFKANKRNLLLAEEYYSSGLHQGSGIKYFLPFIILFALAMIFIGIMAYYVSSFLFHLIIG